MGFLLWEEGSGKQERKGKQDLRVWRGEAFFVRFLSFNSGVTLKGLRGVENAAVAVEESSVLDVKSGTALIISSGRVLVFN